MRLLVAFCVLAVALASSRHVFFDRWNVPTDYVRGGFAPADAKVGFIIALRQRNLEALEELFWATSDPKASTYQQYRTIAEIQELVAPDQHAVTPVMEWLKEHGVQSVINHADALEVVCDVKTAEKLFETRFYSFLHVPTGKQYVRAWGTMSHPAEFTSIIEMIVGVSSFPIPKYKAKVYAPNDDQGIVPQTIWQLYQVPAQTAGGAATTSVGVIEFEQQFFTPSDLTSFGQNVNVPVQAVAASHIVGPNDPTSPQIESTLDIQMVAGVNDATTPWFWIEGDPSTWLYGFCTHFFTTKDVPQVVSISYGWSEADQCDIDPTVCQQLGVSGAGYAARVNTEFQKIALRGISVLVASGDSGANGRTDPDCSLPYLKPDFPAASPYVTSVGATQLNNPQFNLNNAPPVCNGQGYQCPSGGDEVAVSYDEASFASGGGFSNVAAQPAFQKAAVAGYFSSGVILPPSTYYNATGRGYPDISAMGNAVLIFQGGIQPVGGTSASAPIWAAIVGVANQASLKKTGKPLGYLNQWLYTMAAECPNCFHDITVGDNICTEDGCSPSCQGYKATKGWDPVTGLGSPNTANIIAYINK